MISQATYLVGNHPSIREASDLICRVAESPARTVLIYGETGTGKGVAARMLHRLSARADQPFVDLNCAAIPDSLPESELFGYEKGAFTGAAARKIGLVEAAHGGTLFLDEIREMDLTLQAKLLSFLDTQSFRPIGSVRPVEVNVRFVAATNRILLSEVKAGKFREDLYYRLQVIAINLPPLRERGEDVMILTEHFLKEFSDRFGSRVSHLEPDVERIFKAYSWPGNVRELSNLVERIFILGSGDTVQVKDLPARILREVDGVDRIDGLNTLPPIIAQTVPEGTHTPIDGSFHDATAAFQRTMIRGALKQASGQIGKAAQALGLSRHALRYQIDRLGIEVSARS